MWLFQPGALADQIIKLCDLMHREFGRTRRIQDGADERKERHQRATDRWELCLRSLSGPEKVEQYDEIFCLVPCDGILYRPRPDALEKVLWFENKIGRWNCRALMVEVGTYAHVRDVKEDEAAFEVGTRALILARELVHHAAMKGEDEVMELLSVGSEYDVFATLLDVASNRTLAQGVRALSLDVCLTAVSSRLYCADPNDSNLINRVEPRQAATFVQAAFELFCEDTPPQHPLEWITGSGSWVMDALRQDVRRPRWTMHGVQELDPMHEKRTSRFLKMIETTDALRRFPVLVGDAGLASRDVNKIEASLRGGKFDIGAAQTEDWNHSPLPHLGTRRSSS